MFSILMCLCMVGYKILKNKEKIKKLSVKQIVAIGVLYAFMFTIAFCMIYVGGKLLQHYVQWKLLKALLAFAIIIVALMISSKLYEKISPKLLNS
ncbi:YfhO family protein [Lysinibacillus fusiformis]|nr:YfhO family protein [Lysinibacillus fusiformis]